MKNSVLRNEQIKVHPMLEETFTFADKNRKTISVENDFSHKKLSAVLFHNLFMQKKDDIYPICKAYYNNYKMTLETLPFSNRDNIFDFLCTILQKDKNGKMIYLERLYERKDITPKTFTSLYALLQVVDSSLISSVSQFLCVKEKKEKECFDRVVQFINQIDSKFYRLEPPFLSASKEEVQTVLQETFLQEGDYYRQVLQMKALSPKMRSTFFQMLYRMKVPFSSSDLEFFLSSSHLNGKKLLSILDAFSIQKEQFDAVLALSICIDPSLIHFYYNYLSERGKTEAEVSFYPSFEQIQKTKEKLASSPSKRKVLQG